VWILFINTRRKFGLHSQTMGTVLDRGGQAVVRGSCLSHLLDRVARGAVPGASQVLDRGAEAVFRGTARCAWHVLARGAQAGTQTVTCGDATLPQQKKSTWQVSRRSEGAAIYLRRIGDLAVAAATRRCRSRRRTLGL
jgi:hypothetical protein